MIPSEPQDEFSKAVRAELSRRFRARARKGMREAQIKVLGQEFVDNHPQAVDEISEGSLRVWEEHWREVLWLQEQRDKEP